MNQKCVYIIYTGGTIGIQKTVSGYQPTAGYLAQQMKHLTEFQHPDMPNYTLTEFDPLLDSSDMYPTSWQQIANTIANVYDDYDGFVILHGTDTMAYTASALSFMLSHLDKPVIITGSQVPLAEVHTDARENLLVAMLLASNADISEVCIFFDNQLMRGNRCHKLDAKRAHAFISPNYPLLAEVGTDINLFHDHLRIKPKGKFHIIPIEAQPILCLTLFPGLDFHLVKQIIQPPLKAILLISFGAGNAPIHNATFMQWLKRLQNQNILIANTTQCQVGGVNMNTYKNGRMLKEAGVISTHDMTLEASLCKLHYLLTHHADNVTSLLPQNLAGELTVERNGF